MSSALGAVATAGAVTLRSGPRVAGAVFRTVAALGALVWNNKFLILAAALLAGFGLVFAPAQASLLSSAHAVLQCVGQVYNATLGPLLVQAVDFANPFICFYDAVTWTALRGTFVALRQSLDECGTGVGTAVGATGDSLRVLAGDLVVNQTLNLAFLANGYNLAAYEQAARSRSRAWRNLTECICADLTPALAPLWDAYDSDTYWDGVECALNALVTIPRYIFAGTRDALDGIVPTEQPRFDEWRRNLCCATTSGATVLGNIAQAYSNSFTGTFDTIPASELACIVGNSLCTAAALFSLVVQAAFNARALSQWPSDTYYATTFRPAVLRAFNLVGEPLPALDPRLSFPLLASPAFLAGGGYDPNTFIHPGALAAYVGSDANATRLNECACGFATAVTALSPSPAVAAFDPCPIFGLGDTAADVAGWGLDTAFNFFQLPSWAHFWDLRFVERPFTTQGFTAIIPSFFVAPAPALALGLSQALASVGMLVFTGAEVGRVAIMTQDSFGFLQTPTGFGPSPQIRCTLTAPGACNVRDTVDAALLLGRDALGNTCQGLSDAVGVDITGLCCAPQQVVLTVRSVWLLVYEVLHASAFGDPDALFSAGDRIQQLAENAVGDFVRIPACSCPIYKTLLALLATGVGFTLNQFTPANAPFSSDVKAPVVDPEDIRVAVFNGLNALLQEALPGIGDLCEVLFQSLEDLARAIARIVVSIVVNFSRQGIVGGYFLDGSAQPGTSRRLFSALDYRDLLEQSSLFGTSPAAPTGQLDQNADLSRLASAAVRVVFVPVHLLSLLPIFDGGEVLFLEQTLSLIAVATVRLAIRPLFKAAQGDFGYFTDFERGLNRSVMWRLTSPFVADMWRLLDTLAQPPGTPNVPASVAANAIPTDGLDVFKLPNATTYGYTPDIYPITRPGVADNKPTEAEQDATATQRAYNADGPPQIPWTLVNAAQLMVEAVLPGPWGNALFCPVRRAMRIFFHVFGLPLEFSLRLSLAVGSAASSLDFVANVFNWAAGTPDPRAELFNRGFAFAASIAPLEEVPAQVAALFRCACGLLNTFTVGPAICLCDAGVDALFAGDGVSGVGLLNGVGDTIGMLMLIVVGLIRDSFAFNISVTDNIVVPLGTVLASVLNQATCFPRKLIGLFPGFRSAASVRCSVVSVRTRFAPDGSLDRVEPPDTEVVTSTQVPCDATCIFELEQFYSTTLTAAAIGTFNGVFGIGTVVIERSATCAFRPNTELDLTFIQFTNTLTATLFSLPLLLSSLIGTSFGRFINTDRATYQGGVAVSGTGTANLDPQTTCLDLYKAIDQFPPGALTPEDRAEILGNCPSRAEVEALEDRHQEYAGRVEGVDVNESQQEGDSGDDALFSLIIGVLKPVLNLAEAGANLLAVLTRPVPGVGFAFERVLTLVSIVRTVALTLITLVYHLFMVLVSFLVNIPNLSPITISSSLSISFPLLDVALDVIQVFINAITGKLYDEANIHETPSFASPLNIPSVGGNDVRSAPRGKRSDADTAAAPSVAACAGLEPSATVLRSCVCRSFGLRFGEGVGLVSACDAGVPMDASALAATVSRQWDGRGPPLNGSAASASAPPARPSASLCAVHAHWLGAAGWGAGSGSDHARWMACVQRLADSGAIASNLGTGPAAPRPAEVEEGAWGAWAARVRASARAKAEPRGSPSSSSSPPMPPPARGGSRRARQREAREARDAKEAAAARPPDAIRYPSPDEVRAAKVRVLRRMMPQFDEPTQAWLRGAAEHPPGLEQRPHGRMLARMSRHLIPYMNLRAVKLSPGPAERNVAGDATTEGGHVAAYGRACCAWVAAGDPAAPKPIDWAWFSSGTHSLRGGGTDMAAACASWRAQAQSHRRGARSAAVPESLFGTRRSCVLCAREGSAHGGGLHRSAKRRARAHAPLLANGTALAQHTGHWMGSGYVAPLTGEAPLRYIPGMPHVRLRGRHTRRGRTPLQHIQRYNRVRKLRSERVERVLTRAGIVGNESPLLGHHQHMLLRGLRAVDHVTHALLTGAVSSVVGPVVLAGVDPQTGSPLPPASATEAAFSARLRGINPIAAAVAWVSDTSAALRRVHAEPSPTAKVRAAVQRVHTRASRQAVIASALQAMRGPTTEHGFSPAAAAVAFPELKPALHRAAVALGHAPADFNLHRVPEPSPGAASRRSAPEPRPAAAEELPPGAWGPGAWLWRKVALVRGAMRDTAYLATLSARGVRGLHAAGARGARSALDALERRIVEPPQPQPGAEGAQGGCEEAGEGPAEAGAPALPWWASATARWIYPEEPPNERHRNMRAAAWADFSRHNSTAYVWWRHGAGAARDHRARVMRRRAAASPPWSARRAQLLRAANETWTPSTVQSQDALHAAARYILAGDVRTAARAAPGIYARGRSDTSAMRRAVACPKCGAWTESARAHWEHTSLSKPAFAARRDAVHRHGTSATDATQERRERATLGLIRLLAKASDAAWPDHPEGIAARVQRRFERLGVAQRSPLAPRHRHGRGGVTSLALDQWRMRQWVWRMRMFVAHKGERPSCGRAGTPGCHHHGVHAHAHVRNWLLGGGCRVVDLVYRDASRFFTYCGALTQPRPEGASTRNIPDTATDWPRRRAYAAGDPWLRPETSPWARRGGPRPGMWSRFWARAMRGPEQGGTAEYRPHWGIRVRTRAHHTPGPGPAGQGAHATRAVLSGGAVAAARDGTVTRLALPLLDALCVLLDTLFGSDFQGAADDLASEVAETAANPVTTGPLEQRGIRGVLAFHATCPPIDGVSCVGGVGLVAATGDFLPVLGVAAVAGLVFMPVAPVIAVVMVPVFVVYVATHAWRYPLACVFALQVPLCAPNDIVALLASLFRSCYSEFWESTGLLLDPTPGASCTQCGSGTTVPFIDFSVRQEGTIVGNTVFLAAKFIPGVCTVGKGLLGGGLLGGWLFPSLGRALTQSCVAIGAGGTAAARALAESTGAAKITRGGGWININLGILGFILLYLIIRVVIILAGLAVALLAEALAVGVALGNTASGGGLGEVVGAGDEASDPVGVAGAGFGPADVIYEEGWPDDARYE